MPRGYVPNPTLTVPTNPAFYDAMAGGMGEGILEGVQDVAKGAFSYVQNKQASSEREKMARQLLASLIEDGVPPEQAKISTLEYVTQGTQELMKAWQNRKVIAAELKSTEATTAQTQATTAQVAPNAEASRANLAAETADIPVDSAIAQQNADTTRENVRGNLGMQRSELDAKIDKETREFAAQFDTDESGMIDGEEYEKLFAANRRKVEAEALESRAGLTEDEMFKKAQELTSIQASDYATLRTDKPWTKLKLRGGVTPPDGGGTAGAATQQAWNDLSAALAAGTRLDEAKIRSIVTSKYPGAAVDAIIKRWQGAQ